MAQSVVGSMILISADGGVMDEGRSSLMYRNNRENFEVGVFMESGYSDNLHRKIRAKAMVGLNWVQSDAR